MLDPTLVRDRVEEVRTALANRGMNAEAELEALARLDGRRRTVIPAMEELKRQRNAAGEEIARAKKQGQDIAAIQEANRQRGEQIKELEHAGYQFEAAEGSFELLVRKAMGEYEPYFELKAFRVIDEKRSEGEAPVAEATIMVVVDGKEEHTAAMGNGPVNAMDNALRKALEKFYPELAEVRLLDYKVRVISVGGTGSSVRVLIQSGDKDAVWGTVGVSHNIIEASWQALGDSIRYKLWRSRHGGEGPKAKD